MGRQRDRQRPARRAPETAPDLEPPVSPPSAPPTWLQRLVRQVLAAAGYAVLLVSLLFVVVFAVELIQGNTEHEAGILIGLIVFFIGTGIGGVALIRGGNPFALPRPPRADGAPEVRILRLAAMESGRLTIPEVAAHCQLTLEQAKQELDRLVVTKQADMEITADGVLVYVVRGFLSDREKAAASDL